MGKFSPSHTGMRLDFKRVLLLMGLLLLFTGICAFPSHADDKNGVTPNTISLPEGPGSIEGLGESFQPMLNTGTARYQIKFALPPGTGGHTPQLSLLYESGFGDGPAGIGWKFGPGDISRRTDKGIPRYVDGPNGTDDDHDGETDEADEVDRFIGAEGEELVQLSDGTFRARIEGSFIRYRRVEDHWEANLKDGTTLLYGLTTQARVMDQTGSKVFKWLLEKSTDTNGNVIEYIYEAFPNSENRKYLKEIRYGPGAPDPESGWPVFYFAALSYEDRADWRKDYRSGFLVQTAKRLAQVDIGIQGAAPAQCAIGDFNRDDTPDALIRRYSVSYQQTDIHSFLSKVTRFGSDGVNLNYLPPISFSYSYFSPDPITSAAGAVITSSTAPAVVMDNALVELIDLNRDGLSDILKTDLYGSSHTAYFNEGSNDQGGTHALEWSSGRTITSPDGLASLLHLAEKEVHLADMDGNGISDLIHTTYSKEVFYYPNQGDGSWGERKQMSIQDTAPPAPFTDNNVKTSDLNFDKRIDVVKSTENGYTIWFNLEEGKYSREVRTAGAVYEGSVVLFSQTGVHLADINGDRLSDVARIRPTQVVYCANMGHGRFDTALEMTIPDAVLTDGANGQVERAKLEDINGDGLSDLVIERAQTDELWYWLNRGTDTFSGKHVVTDMPTLFGEGMVTRWADMNENGTTDLVYADSMAASRLRVIDIGELTGGSSHPNLLTGIDNGLGVRTEITYKSSTEFYLAAAEQGSPWSTTVPFPVSVVARVRTATGLDVDTVPGEDIYIKDYTYRDGFYEDREKAFRGFAEVVVTEYGDDTAPTRLIRHRFFTGGPDNVDNDGDGEIDEVAEPWWHREEDALKGMVRGVEVSAEDGTLFTVETNLWQVRNLALSVDNVEVRFAYNQSAEKAIYEGTDTPKILRTTFEYDDFGNVRAKRNAGDIDIPGDEAFTFSDYINDTDLWLIGFPVRQRITDQAGTKTAETVSYYDGNDYVGLPGGQAIRGNLTRQEGWVEDDRYVNLIRNAYDAYGNIIGIQDPNGNTRTIVYDDTLHIYPEQEIIAVGGGSPDLEVTVAYNLGLGVLTSSIDFNGHQTDYGYDTFGRLTSIVRSGDSPQLPTLAFSHTMTDPANGILYEYDADGVLALPLPTGALPPSSVMTRAREVSGQEGTFDTIQYMDGMGRKLASLEEDEQGFVVNEAVLFNAMGGIQYSFLPYSAISTDYAPPALGHPAVESRYDVVGRVILSINPPDDGGVITHASIAYRPLEKTDTDENGNSKAYFFDGLERLVQVHEENQGETYITRYTYDPLGNLKQIIDAQNNVKTMVYDGLKRRIILNDPDRGRFEYTYDDAGNLIRTEDNKTHAIVYTYDGANRMLTEDYLDAAAITPDVKYHYDAPSADYPYAENTRGEVTFIEDLSGALFFSYDSRGNAEWSVKRIKDDGFSQDFMFLAEYDAMNRVVSQTFPDGDQTAYTYNTRSLLQSIPGFVDNIDYSPSGQIQRYAYANGLTTTYDYDPRNRPNRLITVTEVPSGDPIQSLTYTFDGVSNILAIDDHRTVAPDSPQNATQAFQYDDLYRLTQANGPGYGIINYQYDKIGNMIFKSSPPAPEPGHIDDPLINLRVMTSGGTAGTSSRGLKQPGDPPGPHAITATESGMVFDYDDNGNMTFHAGDIYEWDFKDRLIRTTTSTTVADYVYDYSGRRVIKKSESGGERKTAYYVSKGFEIRDGKWVKYIFDGSRRVARVEGRLAENGDASSQVLNFRSGWNFFSLKVEPEDQAIETVLSTLADNYLEVWMFDPPTGQYRGYVPEEGRTDFTELHAQQGYIIKVIHPAITLVTGTRTTNDISLHAGWSLIPSPADAPMPVADAFASIAGKYDSVWEHDKTSGSFRSYLPEQPSFLSNLDIVQPGSSYWIKTTETTQLVFQQQERKTYFYHPDHLGSSNVVTDSAGVVVEETQFYPYGRPRYEERTEFDSVYKYTSKELDEESGLMYYGVRYYDALVGRFVSVDPLLIANPNKGLNKPSKFNLYSYCRNNSIVRTDPSGLDDEDAVRVIQPDDYKKIEKYHKEAQKYAAIGKAVGMVPKIGEVANALGIKYAEIEAKFKMYFALALTGAISFDEYKQLKQSYSEKVFGDYLKSLGMAAGGGAIEGFSLKHLEIPKDFKNWADLVDNIKGIVDKLKGIVDLNSSVWDATTRTAGISVDPSIKIAPGDYEFKEASVMAKAAYETIVKSTGWNLEDIISDPLKRMAVEMRAEQMQKK